MKTNKNEYAEYVQKKLYAKQLLKEADQPLPAGVKLQYLDALCLLKKAGVKTLLDVGCGQGNLLKLAQENEFDAYGIDASKDAVVCCKKKGLKVKQADVLKKLPFANNTFDGVTCFHVLEHLWHPEVALYEIKRILKPGGIAYVVVPDFDPRFFYREDWSHIKPLDKYTMRRLAEIVGFSRYTVKRLYGYLFPQYYHLPLIPLLNKIFHTEPFASVGTWFIENILRYQIHHLVLIAKNNKISP